MQTDYWKAKETKLNAKEWLQEYEGSLLCDCGHGCRQWIEEQRFRAGLLFRVMLTPNYSTKLEKITQMPLEDVMRLYHKLLMRDSREWNRREREGKNDSTENLP